MESVVDLELATLQNNGPNKAVNVTVNRNSSKPIPTPSVAVPPSASSAQQLNSFSLALSPESPRFSIGSASSVEDVCMVKASELFPKKSAWCEDGLGLISLPLLPSEHVLFQGRSAEGVLAVTNYRLLIRRDEEGGGGGANPANLAVNVPLGLLDTVECRDIFYVHITCKDARSIRCVFSSSEASQDWAKRFLALVSIPRRVEDVFALAFHAWSKDEHSQPDTAVATTAWWKTLNNNDQETFSGQALFRSEVQRQEYDTSGAWRISLANVDYKLCPTYPQYLLVPACISDEALESVAAFRSARRIPAVVWRHRRNGAVLARSSQPEVGWLGWRSSDDEDLLRAILDACACDQGTSNERLLMSEVDCISTTSSSNQLPGGKNVATLCDGRRSNASEDNTRPQSSSSSLSDASNNVSGDSASLKDLSEDSSCFRGETKKLLIVDARSYATAVANRARGGGCEFPQYYPRCDIEFMNLANIHAIRKSFQALRTLCCNNASADQSNWLSQLEASKWLQHLAGLLRAASFTAAALEREARPVLVHCSDGWDRTPQIVALAQLLLDPFYRTIQGFQVLCEREWLEFGHKFADRCGVWGGTEDLNERCPVFLQFLDCVHQLVHQFPTAFEFNQAFLVKLAQHTYSNLFGTFLCNSSQERLLHRVASRAHSVWKYLASLEDDFRNYLFAQSGEFLCPSYQIRDLVVWSAVYLGDETSQDLAPPPVMTLESSVTLYPENRFKERRRETGDIFDGKGELQASPGSTNSSGYNTPQGPPLGLKRLNTWGCCPNSSNDSSATYPSAVVESSSDRPVHHNANCSASVVDLVHQLTRQPTLEKSTDTITDDFPLVAELTELRVVTNTPQMEFHGEEFDQLPCPVFEDVPDSGMALKVAGTAGAGGKGADCGVCATSLRVLERRQEDCYTPGGSREVKNVLGADGDGLPLRQDPVQARLRQLLYLKEMELEGLRRDLQRTRLALCQQICHTCSGQSPSYPSNTQPSSPDRLRSADLSPNPPRSSAEGSSSIPSSWEALDHRDTMRRGMEEGDDGSGRPTLWVPDHAAPLCMGCGTPFWIGRRRHHCRNCGRVFCGECTQNEVPVPSEQLFHPVRVCVSCYELLADEQALRPNAVADTLSAPLLPSSSSSFSATVTAPVDIKLLRPDSASSAPLQVPAPYANQCKCVQSSDRKLQNKRRVAAVSN